MFKRLITATLAAVAATALAASAPAAAQSGTAGDLSMGIGWLSLHGTPPNVSNLLFTGAGRGNVALGMNWNLEAQAGVRSIFQSKASGTQGAPALVDAYAHFWGRHPSAAFGVVAGVASDIPLFTSVGGEIKGYTARASFGAAAGVSFFRGGTVSQTAWTLNASKNFFINPNVRLGLRGAIVTGLALPGATRHNVWEATLDYEQRLPGAPLSLWLGVTRVGGLTAGLDGWRTEGGIKFFMDAPKSSLQSHDRDVPFTFNVPTILSY